MTESSPSLDPDEILAHAAWVRRLAARLLDDASLVDDVVQETWLVAMARRPRGAGLRAWLGGIVRNVVRQNRRAEGRRRRRETRAARFSSEASARDLVAEAEVQTRLVRAVLALPEPYRSTLLMRYFEDLSAEQIAGRLGLSSSTVRNRQRRALALLREGLDVQFGGDGTHWSLALLPLATAGMSTASAPALPLAHLFREALLVTTTKKIAAAVTVLALTGSAWWVAAASGEVPAAEVVAPVVTLPDGKRAAVPKAAAAVVEDLVIAEGKAPASAELSASSAAPADRPGDPVRFDGRVVDTHGVPVPGATVTYVPDSHTLVAWGTSLQAQFGSLAELDLPRVTTDDAGQFSLSTRFVVARFSERATQRVINGLNYPELVVSAAGLGTVAHVLRGYEGGDLRIADLVMGPGGELHGRVIDEAGLPVEGVRVHGVQLATEWMQASDDIEQKGHAGRLLEAHSGADGRWRIQGVPEGGGSLRFSLSGYLTTTHPSIRFAAGDVHDLGDVTLKAGGSLGGVVVDEQGLPIQGVRVLARSSDFSEYGGSDRVPFEVGSGGGVMTDVDGVFLIRALTGGTHFLGVDAPGFEPRLVPGVRMDRTDVVIRLMLQSELLLRVLDGTSGAAIPSASVRAERHSGIEDWDPLELVVRDDDEDAHAAVGLFVVERPGLIASSLVISAPGYATLLTSAPGVPAGGRETLTIRMEPQCRISGRVTDTAGKPLDQGLVIATLAATEPPPRRPDSKGYRLVSEILKKAPEPTVVGEAVIDAEGRFELLGLAAELLLLKVELPGYVDRGREPIQLARAQAREGLRLTVERCATLSGLILGLDGTPARGHSVGMFATDKSRNGSTMTGLDGRFTIDDLPAGSYRLQSDPGIHMDLVLAPGEHRELELKLRSRPRLSGRVYDPLTGAGLEGAHVHLASWRDWDGVRTRSWGNWVSTDENGRYVLAEAWSGAQDLVASLPGGVLSPPVAVQLSWGDDKQVDVPMGTGRLAGRLERMDAEAAPAGAWVGLRPLEGGSPAGRVVRCDAEGDFHIEHIAPGSYTIRYGAPGLLALDEPQLSFSQAGEQQQDITLRLGPAGSVEGSVSLPNGEPVPDGTRLHLLPEDRHPQSWGRLERTEGGAFRFSELPPGRYELVVGDMIQKLRNGTDAVIHWRKPLALAAGETRRFEIIVEP